MEESTQLRPSDDTLASGPRRRSGAGLTRGSSLGRYVVLERLGAGGMGAVYAAFDPQLDRRVALKVLHAELARRDPTGTPRLLREAQAMARLTHPNVVTVHDVGLEDEQLFVAMELVDGETLKAWCANQARTQPQRLAVCVAAGRGLAAAHAHELVHRDFKPDNVMVAADGRVLVMDFGLARGADGGEFSSSGDAMTISAVNSSSELTQTGTVLGTPAYMSPEQFAGDVADARSDQFAFCVTTWEAIYGERPFAGDSLASLARAVRAAELREPPKGRRVPAAIRVALTRGLSADPARRYPSMEALLGALAKAERRQRTRLFAGVGFVTLGGAGALAVMSGATIEADACPSAEPQIAQRWNEERASALALAFEATEVRYATAAWTRARQQLDAFFSSWTQTHTAVCEATHVAHEQSPARLDLRMDCLTEGLRRADAILEELALVDGPMVGRATDMVSGLPRPLECATTTLATNSETWTDEHAGLVIEARKLHASAKARLDAGRGQSALDAVEDGLARLTAVRAPRLRADLLAAKAEAEYVLGQLDDSEATLQRALGVASEGNLADQEAALWVTLMHVVGELQKRPKAAAAYLLPARLATQRAKRPELHARLARVAGQTAMGEGRAHDAIEHYRTALSLAADQDPGGPAEIVIRNNLGNALFEVNRYADALEQMQRVHRADLARYGEDHPTIALDLMNLGRIHNAQGATDQARREYREAVALNERLLGPDSTAVGNCLLNLGGVEKAAGNLALAREHYERALAIYEATLRPDHPYLGFALTNLGSLLSDEGKLQQALPLQERALAIVEENYGQGHPRTLTTRGNLANLLANLGRNEEAIEAFEKVIELRETKNGRQDLGLAYPLLGLAQAMIDVDRAEESVHVARRALTLRIDGEAEPRLIGIARFVVAITERAAGHHDTAVAEARLAAQTLAPDGPTPSPIHAQIVDWLSEHGA